MLLYFLGYYEISFIDRDSLLGGYGSPEEETEKNGISGIIDLDSLLKDTESETQKSPADETSGGSGDSGDSGNTGDKPSKTGDTSIIAICASVMAVSAAALVVVLVKNKKQHA